MIEMNLFGHGQWYTGELNPNQFATDNNGQLAPTQQKQGLSDAFNEQQKWELIKHNLVMVL